MGEFLVSAELCRRGLLATPFSGNVPHYDIIASGEHIGHLAIQVKAINRGNWQLNASKFVDIKMDGDRQVLGERVEAPYPDLFCVFVAVGDSNTKDRYFVFSWEQLAEIVVSHHAEWLAAHGWIRPRAPKSTHCSIGISQIEMFEDQWDSVLQAVKANSVASRRRL